MLTQRDMYDYLEDQRVPIGALVMFANMPARVVAQDGTGLAMIVMVGDMESERRTVHSKNLTVVPNTDLREPNIPLARRRQRFIKIVGEIANALYDRNRVARELYAMLSMSGQYNSIPGWFIQSLAMASDDPMQISWASSIEMVDVDAGRRRGTPAAFIKYIIREFDVEVPDWMPSGFQDVFYEHIHSGDMTVSEVSGEDVVRIMNELPSMYDRYGVRWYAENPQSVSLLAVHRDNELVGRATVWTTTGGQKIVDTIHPARNGPIARLLAVYAQKSGYLFHDPGGYAGRPEGVGLSYNVKMKMPSDGQFPYGTLFQHIPLASLSVDDDGVEWYEVHNNSSTASRIAGGSNQRKRYILDSTYGGYAEYD